MRGCSAAHDLGKLTDVDLAQVARNGEQDMLHAIKVRFGWYVCSCGQGYDPTFNKCCPGCGK